MLIRVIVNGTTHHCSSAPSPRCRRKQNALKLHPIPITRFRYVRTQPLESFSAAVKLPIKKRFLGNPTLGKSIVRENIVMGTGCIGRLKTIVWCDDCWQFSNQATVCWYALIQIQSLDEKQSHHMTVSAFRAMVDVLADNSFNANIDRWKEASSGTITNREEDTVNLPYRSLRGE